MESMHTDDMKDVSDTDEESEKAMIEQIKRDSLKQLEEAEKVTSVYEDPNVSTTDIFYQGDDARGFFLSSGETYIYPTNYPIRDYQRNIVQSCLFENTLVSLPTGLGKTFIAAVVMYNFYRWYPRGKIVFMAPTRPLVSQQMRACYDIMGIPVEDTIELQGNTAVAVRKKEWHDKRVFYVTPQTIDNDLRSGVFNPEHLKCLVIDEAHRATKNYAYCQVVQQLQEANVKFRLVALSATPGREIQDVINLIRKLDIAKLELRSENSIDIVPYTHNKKIDSVQVPLSDLVLRVREEFLKIIDKYTRSLKQNKVLVGNTGTLTKFLVMLAKDKYVKSKAQFPHINRDLDRMIQRDFHVTHSLASALENLVTYGLRSFYNNLVEVSKEDGSCPILGKDNDLQNLLQQLKPKLDINIMSSEYAWSHLKFIRLREILESHFRLHAEKGETTKVIIFANYRVVVAEIFDVLKPLEPMVKASMFVGQSSGVTQQEQKEIMKKFRAGEFNTLIATSVGEEGLDIGEIDLVICFDAQKSPIKMVQRLGRTGRKRNGRCVILLTQGREAHNFQTSMQTCKSYVEKIINNKSIYVNLAKNGPRMIPAHVTPRMKCLHIVVKDRVTPAKPSKKKSKENEKANKKSKKKLETDGNSEPAVKQNKTNAKKTKKQPMMTQSNDIRTCFENITKKKKTFIDFLTQSSGEPVIAMDDEVVIVQDQHSEFEQIFAKLEVWADKCVTNEEFIVDEQFFDLMDNFLVSDADQTPVDVMDVDEMLETEDRIFHVINEDHNVNFETNSPSIKPDINPSQRPQSPDFSDNFQMDFMDHVFSPYEKHHSVQQNEKTLDLAPCSSPIQNNHCQNPSKTSKALEEILDDGNDDMFLNINSLVPKPNTPVKQNGLCLKETRKIDSNMSVQQIGSNQSVKRIDSYFPVIQPHSSTPERKLESNTSLKQNTSVYQTVEELFASDDDSSPVNNDLRSYFVSEHEVEPGYIEPMSISDLFEDSEDEDNPGGDRQDKKNEQLRPVEILEPRLQQQHLLSNRTTPGREVPKKTQDWPCSSTPMISNGGVAKQFPDTINRDKPITDNLQDSPDLGDIFVRKTTTAPSTTSNKTQRSPFTPKQRLTHYFQSPDVSEIKSQAVKPTAMSGVKMNLQSKFQDTSYKSAGKLFPPTKSQDRPDKSPSCEIIFDSDSDENDLVVHKTNASTLDGTNMFTVTQLVDMACEREKKMKESNLPSHSIHNKSSDLKASVSNKANIFPSSSNKENLNVKRTPRKLDGMEIVDTSDDELMLDMQQTNQSLIHSYTSTLHLAHPKPKLPQTTSVLSKLSYVEENGINNTDINTNPPIVSKPANTKNTVNDTSSDEDLEFFIPKRNPKKNPVAIPKSPLLLSKVKSKPKVTFPNSNDSVNSQVKKNTSISNLSLNDSEEELELLRSLAAANERLGPMNNGEVFSAKTKPSATTFAKPFSRTPFTSQASKPSQDVRPSASKTSIPTSSNTLTKPSPIFSRETTVTSQPTTSTNLEQEFGGMTDAQFEEWLKNLNEVSKEPEPVTSQYFQPKPNVINANQVLMSNRGNLKPSQKVSKTTLTRREKEDFERPRKEPGLNRQPSSILKESSSVNKSILDKSSSSNTSVLCISSEDDEDLYFFKTTGKPDTRNESRPKPNEPRSKPTSRNSKPSESRNPKQRKKVRKKANPYIEEEADVSVLDGQGMSSDDDLTNSSQDEMDSSFIDDEQDRDQTMGVYLKSVRSPQHSAKFKIPVLSDTVLNMDVYSQAVAPDRTEYLNDSFCVSDEECEDSNENEASLLELAEARLEMERKMKKKGRGRMEKGREGRMEKGREGGMEKGSEKVKPRRRVIQMISSSDED
ncbi:hypothetical protein M8J77_009606 [Diaphorina citri]|nr:hypothetical protein M8J77_009606 [Diaphorina citri]